MKKQRAFSMMLSRGVVMASENTTAEEISQMMEEHNIGAVVITKADKLTGIVSERDITRRVVAKRVTSQHNKKQEFHDQRGSDGPIQRRT